MRHIEFYVQEAQLSPEVMHMKRNFLALGITSDCETKEKFNCVSYQ